MKERKTTLWRQEAKLPRCDRKTRFLNPTLPNVKAKKDIKRLQCMYYRILEKNIRIHLRYQRF